MISSNKRLGVWILVVLLLTLCVAVVQAMSLRELRTLEKSDKRQGDLYVRYYLVGVMEGALEASAQAERTGGLPVICLGGRRLEPRMARELFDGELRRNRDMYEADMPVQFVMQQALASAYPCE
jgi:type II secretory pathway component PulK